MRARARNQLQRLRKKVKPGSAGFVTASLTRERVKRKPPTRREAAVVRMRKHAPQPHHRARKLDDKACCSQQTTIGRWRHRGPHQCAGSAWREGNRREHTLLNKHAHCRSQRERERVQNSWGRARAAVGSAAAVRLLREGSWDVNTTQGRR